MEEKVEETEVTEVEETTEEVNEIDELKKQIKELEEKNIRLTADMVNFRKRKEEEVDRYKKYASEDIIMKLLEVIDNFERALNSESEDGKEFMTGVEMIYKSILKILEEEDVKEIEALGKEFDPNVHQAVMTDHKEDAKANEIIEVFQKGYTYKGKVIRPTMVKVNQ